MNILSINSIKDARTIILYNLTSIYICNFTRNFLLLTRPFSLLTDELDYNNSSLLYFIVQQID